jgi:uncharacterized membrane protein (DUF4010 family)
MSEREILGLAAALGIGLLMGFERERRKGRGPGRGDAGLRTFAVVALLGGVSQALGALVILAAAALFVTVVAGLGYLRSDRSDPGVTTEMALFLAFLLGALAQGQPALASGIAVVVTILLASRESLHRFARGALSPQELHDAMLLFAAALVVLPLTPNRRLGPLGVLNPRLVWTLVVLVMAINAAGYIAVRLFGARVGLPLAGFFSGFVSSAATIASLGERAREDPGIRSAAVAGAVLSTVSTVIQLAVVIGATHPPTLRQAAWPLAAAGAAALAFAARSSLRVARQAKKSEPMKIGRPVEVRLAIFFAATVTGVLFLSAAMNQWAGRAGLVAAAALAGFADTHAAAISVASLAAAGKLAPPDALVPILAAFSANTVTKGALALRGGRPFAVRVIPGLLLVLAAAWAGAFWPG